MSFFSRLICLWRDRPDPTAVMQTPVQRFAGYDEGKALAARRRAQARAAELRKINDAYGPHRTDVVRLDTRRAK